MPQDQFVDIKGNQTATFDPSNLPIKINDNVCWRNKTNEMHQPKPVGGADDAWTDPIPSNSPSLRCPGFSKPGTYDYVCALHSGETGTITVG
jgi:plastocyanin